MRTLPHLFDNNRAWSGNGDPDEEKYIWGRIVKENRHAVVWVPDTAKFTGLVKAGELPGNVDDGGGPNAYSEPDVYLGRLDTSHLDRIVSRTNELLFVWDEPLVFMKMEQAPESVENRPDDVVTNTTSSAEEPNDITREYEKYCHSLRAKIENAFPN